MTEPTTRVVIVGPACLSCGTRGGQHDARRTRGLCDYCYYMAYPTQYLLYPECGRRPVERQPSVPYVPRWCEPGAFALALMTTAELVAHCGIQHPFGNHVAEEWQARWDWEQRADRWGTVVAVPPSEIQRTWRFRTNRFDPPAARVRRSA